MSPYEFRQPDEGEYKPPIDDTVGAAFYEHWGIVSGLEEPAFQIMWKLARLESADMPYHNFDHTVEVVFQTMRLADKCERNGLTVNRQVLIGAALFHDARYHQSADTKGFESKEAYSAEVTHDHLLAFGYSEAEIKAAKQAIMATQPGMKPVTVEDKTLVRADLDNIGRSYDTFIRSTDRVHREYIAPHGEIVGNQDDESRFDLPGLISDAFKYKTVELLAGYLVNDLSLGKFDHEYSDWYGKAVKNLVRLAMSTAEGELPPTLQQIVNSSLSAPQ